MLHFRLGLSLRQRYTQSPVSLSPPSGSGDEKSLYSDEYACVLLTNEARLIRLKRTAQAYPDLAALLGSYEKVIAAIDRTGRRGRALLVDGPRGEVAAASHIRPFHQWFGGRAVPLGGYSPVAVLPEYRGRGLARAVVAGQYPDMRERGEVVAGLYPASLALYRSVGFELAGSYVARRFPAAEVGRLHPTRTVEVRRGTPEDVAAVHRCHHAAGPHHDGQLQRGAGWWARSLPPDLADRVLYVVDDPRRPGELAG